MAFWLARQRDGQNSDYIQRFDPRFWTVDFPRPMMGAVFTTGPDSLRAEFEFHHRDALAGLVWSSTDTLDHPLLAYDTDRDYSRTTLRFHWKSGGVMPLDAVNGPTLTIEGSDQNGLARTWYVRLWNYASGTPSDADIALPFSNLSGGWDITASPDPVFPRAIERMFISIVAPDYDPLDASLLPQRADGWIELGAIACDGDRPLLPIGDVMVPPHDIRIASAYDDQYNQTPARLLRNIRGLGYRDEILHYLGMSHYYRVTPQADGAMVAEYPAVFATPATSWHKDFIANCKTQGYDLILSFSFELLAQNCPAAWMQRAHDGSPALTGWTPPSALLTLVDGTQPNLHLRMLAQHLAQLQTDAGMPVRIQIGEPWWWVTETGAPCIYDDAMRAVLDPQVPDITDLTMPLSQAQRDVLATAGSKLGLLTYTVRQEIQSLHGPDAEVMLLCFTPGLLDPAIPDMPLLNLPPEFRSPGFDRLQLEDYDWLTGGAEALRLQAYKRMQDLMGYPTANQDYLAGFVRQGADAEAMWPLIDQGLDEAEARQIPRRFVWALPQVCRDGYTRIYVPKDKTMQPFDDVLYPLALGQDASVSPEFSTAISLTASGFERRSSQWTDARLRFDVGPGIRSESELGTLLAFFRARMGAARGFRLPDPFDFSSSGMTGMPTMLDQQIGTGDGLTATFRLIKSYGGEPQPQVRPVTRPRPDTVLVSIDGIEVAGWTLQPGGKITFDTAPANGTIIRAGFLFDVPVRFAADTIDVSGANFAAGEAPSVPLVEIREAS